MVWSRRSPFKGALCSFCKEILIRSERSSLTVFVRPEQSNWRKHLCCHVCINWKLTLKDNTILHCFTLFVYGGPSHLSSSVCFIMKVIPDVPFLLELAEQNTNGRFRIASLFIRLRENSDFRRKKFTFSFSGSGGNSSTRYSSELTILLCWCWLFISESSWVEVRKVKSGLAASFLASASLNVAIQTSVYCANMFQHTVGFFFYHFCKWHYRV